tara:strand:- start:52 stop:1983 length:1932 start_codon:yes stop_codon:yes gene_type:complete
MSKKILIDASQPTETRIALIKNDKLEECEIETNSNNKIKNNVYLAKITRVEASLQAAFVDFGWKKHGFLPFTEIHPDYFKIPVADQKKLKELISIDEEVLEEEKNLHKEKNSEDNSHEIENNFVENDSSNLNKEIGNTNKERKGNKKRLFFNFFKKYKIQEVIKSRQVILVQINKEERGLKGAALTTYLSFAGRYCVLMPNSNNSIGISRKINDQVQRKNLKEILDSIGIPPGMSVIIRTAGAGKTKAEISKDLNYLINQWVKIRELTLKSNAPTLIYEEGDIIKRTIRDLYTKDTTSIVIDGKEAYAKAKKYTKALIPNQLSKLKLHKEKKEKLFTKYNLEKQIDELYNSEIKLISGGSIVINTTEALVAIDVNSGKATQQRNIESTALNTNLEAAVEIIRQLKLRDLAGLIVIDFIDMEDYRNNFKVEKTLRTASGSDRARIQIGRISPFGLLELSRQRLRTSIVEQSFEKCHLCNGAGIVRNTNSITEQLFKVLDQYCSSNKKSNIEVKCNPKLANEILNNKKDLIIDLEKDYECKINFIFEDSMILNEPKINIANTIKKADVSLSKRKPQTSKILINKKNEIKKNKKNLKKSVESKKISKFENIKNKELELKKDTGTSLTTDDFKNKKTKKGWWNQSAN